MLLYYVRILEESGDVAEALSVLEAGTKNRTIVDRLSVLEIRGALRSWSALKGFDGF